MNRILIKENDIQNMIYEIRGIYVMLDSDLAKLYQCKNGTKDINKAVKRNIERFPGEFCFQLTKDEYYDILRFQIGTLELKQGKYSKYLPYVFTEQGIAMLSSCLHTDIAINISIKIINAFVSMRKYISNNLLSKLDIEKYNKQYHNLEVIYNNTFHDRFFIIDKSIVYHCGTSINSIGNKTFAINRISEIGIINLLLTNIKIN